MLGGGTHTTHASLLGAGMEDGGLTPAAAALSRRAPTAADSVSGLNHFTKLLAACGAAASVVEAETRLEERDATMLDHYGPERAVLWALMRNTTEDWRSAQEILAADAWPMFHAFCSGLEQHYRYEREWLLREWVRACCQAAGDARASFPVGPDGFYAGANPPRVSPGRRVRVVDLRERASTPDAAIRALNLPAGDSHLFHGTTHQSAANIVGHGIRVGTGGEWADFGRGFYLTPDGVEAARWAVRKAVTLGSRGIAAPPAVLAFRDIRGGRPDGECLHLHADSVPTWRQVLDVARSKGETRLPSGDLTLWRGHTHKSAFGAQATQPHGRSFQYAVGSEDLAEAWDGALVAAVFFLKDEPGTGWAAVGGK